MRPQAIQIDEPVDCPQKMTGRHMSFQRELVEQCFLIHPALAHHRSHPASAAELNQRRCPRSTEEFFNKIGAKQRPPPEQAPCGNQADALGAMINTLMTELWDTHSARPKYAKPSKTRSVTWHAILPEK